MEAAYDGLPEVGGASDEEGHGEQEEGGGGVQLHRQVLSGEGGGGQASQVAEHLTISYSYFAPINSLIFITWNIMLIQLCLQFKLGVLQISNKLPSSLYCDHSMLLRECKALKLSCNFVATDNDP